ncbi:prolipoprotein diacylglyceryl transferase [Flammeovirga sp. MY04]|nr:prolipoprotein diacylglyceryl transferase [Flammeovirga sp. MY04]
MYRLMLNFITWNPDPEIFNLFGLSLRYYGLLFMLGIYFSSLVLGKIFEKENLPKENYEKLVTYSVIGIFVGARLGHCLFYEPSYFLDHPIEMILPIKFLPEGGFEVTGYRGLASHGGALGLIIALFVYSKKAKHQFLDILDLLAVVCGLGCGFIRLANLMNSEIIGIPTDLPWAFIFQRIDALPRHPAQLYEAITLFIIFGIMMFLYKNYRSKLKNGFFCGLVLSLIFTARFFIEFIKENQVGFEDGLTFNMGQLLSIPYVLVGIALMTYGWKTTKSKNAVLTPAL